MSLTTLLESVAVDVPRYEGLPAELDAFPVVTKRAMLEDLEAHLARSVEDRDALLELLRAETRSESKYELAFDRSIVVDETSGSSGLPLRVPKRLEERIVSAACMWRFRRHYDPALVPSRMYPFIHEPRGFRTLGYPYEIGPEEVDRLYRAITEHGYTWLHGEPRLFRWHAERISESVARGMSLRFAESSGQRTSPEDRAIIERRLRVRLIDQYGCRETLAIGFRDDDGAFSVLRENVVVELLDDSGARIDEADVPGRITVTALHQRLFPFIRYDNGDRGTWEAGAVGRRFHLLEMREHNRLRLGEQEVDGSAFFKNMLFLSFERMGRVNLSYVQVRQLGPKHFVLATSPSPKAPELRDTLEALMAGGIHHAFPRDARFDLYQLSDEELKREIRGKQTLFTTKYART